MIDPYQNPDLQAPSVIEAMIQRLEDRGENSEFNSFIDDYISIIDLSKVSRILDLGCGTGVVTRRIAAQIPDHLELIGADISERLIDVAREKSDPRIQWQVTDGNALFFEDNSIDLVILHTLLSHVPDPLAILKEVRRILSPDGTAVIFDADYASTSYALEDFAKGQEIDLKLFKAVVHNMNVCRAMPRHLKKAGLTLKKHTGHVISEAGKGDFWLSSVKGFAKLIGPLQILSEEEGDAWVNEMLASHENGTFFAFGNYYTFFAKKS